MTAPSSGRRTLFAGLRATTLLALASVALLIAGHEFERNHPHWDGLRIAAYACAAALAVTGVAATRLAAKDLAQFAGGSTIGTAATPLRLVVRIVGYLLTALAVLDVLHVDLSQFLVGGAVTGVVIGIAAQQALGNFFAGIVLVVARPYAVGDRITVLSGSINGPHDGTVRELGLVYTTLQTGDGTLSIPNSVLLMSGVRHSK